MKIHTKIVWDRLGDVILDDVLTYDGPISEAKGSQTTIQQGQSAPWTAQQGYLTSGFQQAQQQLNSSKPSYYPDSTVVPYSQPTQQGMQQTQDIANGMQMPTHAYNEVWSTISGDHQQAPQNWAAQFSNPNAGAMNPYTQQDPNAYINQLTNSIGRSVVPGVQGQFAGAGRSGDSPMAQQAMAKGISDALAPYAFNSAENAQGRMFSAGQQATQNQYDSAQNAINLGANQFGQERQNQINAVNQAPGVEAGMYGPSQALMNVGAMQEDLSGRNLQDTIDRFNFGQNIDQQKLADYMSLIQGNYGGTNVSQAQKNDSWNVPIPGLGSVKAK